MALYFYATGAQRQAITVLSTIGLTESYTNLTSKKLKRHRKKKKTSDSELQLEGDILNRAPSRMKSLLVQELFTSYLNLCDRKHGRLLPQASTLLFMTILTFNYERLSKSSVATVCN